MTERYEKIKDIGRGGYGSAMLARSLVNQKLYVIKKIGLAKNQATVGDKTRIFVTIILL